MRTPAAGYWGSRSGRARHLPHCNSVHTDTAVEVKACHWISPSHLPIWPCCLFYLVGIVLFGIWVGRGQRDVTDYLLGGRNLPWWAILGSIVATETSTVTFLSVPGLAFAERVPGTSSLDPRVGGDMRFLQLACGLLVGRCLIVYILLPLFFRGKLFSAYEVLHHRFGGATKKVASLVFLDCTQCGRRLAAVSDGDCPGEA